MMNWQGRKFTVSIAAKHPDKIDCIMREQNKTRGNSLRAGSSAHLIHTIEQSNQL